MGLFDFLKRRNRTQVFRTKVFISYTQADEEMVRQIAAEIEQNGFDVWFAPSQLRGGDHLSSIADKIALASFVIVMLSKTSINSEWVKHEMHVALALSLDGKPLRVIPVFLDGVPRPTSVADLVSVNLQPQNYEVGLHELLAVLKGQRIERKSAYSRFQDYVNGLIPVEQVSFQRIDNLAVFGHQANKIDRDNPTAVQRARASISTYMRDANLSEEEQSRVLTAFDYGQALPIISVDERDEARAWIRRGDEELMVLAAELWQAMRHGLRGITLQWIVDVFFAQRRQDMGQKSELAKEEWLAEQLVMRAKEAGLLERSTEYNDPRTYAYQDAQINPSFDLGPMVWVIGRLAHMFQSSDGSRGKKTA